MKKPIIYLLLEIKARELEGKTLLAFEAACRGFRVIVGNKNHIRKGLKDGLLPPGIYFDKSLTPGKENILKEAINKRCLIVSQDEESGLLRNSYENFISVRSTPKTVNMSHSIFCWGKHDYESWINYFPQYSYKFNLVGSPRVDFWRQDFQSYFKSYVDSIKKRFGKFVLISSNFTQANSYMSVKERIERAKRIGVITNDVEEKAKYKSIEDRKLLFKYFVKLIDYLSEEFKDINFLVRPHPSEKISGWESSLPVKNNMKLVFEGSISPWVRASSAVLHNACTTGIESYMANIPPISYNPFPNDRDDKIPNQLSINCVSQIDVFHTLSKIFKGETTNEHKSPEKDELIKNRLINFNSKPASQNIVDVFEHLNVPKSQPIKSNFATKKISIYNKVNHISNTLKGVETKSMRKFPGLKFAELKQIQSRLNTVNSSYRDCKINHLYGDVFVVEKF